jgi:hypothetical protein
MATPSSLAARAIMFRDGMRTTSLPLAILIGEVKG